MHKVKAVVALSQDAPVTVTTINVPDPGKGEALVKVLTCGVCQTDHHYVTGGVGQDFPYLLGHESAGIVEAVGDDSPTSPPATWSSSTGVPSAANAAHAARASRSTASQPTTQPRR